MLKYKNNLFSFLFFTAIVFFNTFQFAPTVQAGTFKNGLTKTAENAGYTDTASLGKKTPEQIIAIIVKTFLGIIGIILLALLLYGGFVWMKARGNEAETKRAQDIIRNATIGIILILSAYAIASFVYSSLFAVGTNNTTSSQATTEYPRH